MKITKLMLSACVAALALVSCNKEEGVSVKGDYKSLNIEIANLFMTKAQGDMIPDGTTVTLEEFRIFLFAGDQLKNTATQADGSAAAYTFTSAANEIQYHFVDPSVNKVVAIANLDLTADQWAAIDTYSEVQALKLQIAAQQNPDALALYAESGLVQDQNAAQHDPANHQNLITNVFKATINFVPRVSRFELDGFAMGFNAENPLYNRITIHQVALNNYYPVTALYNGVEEGTLTGCDPANATAAIAYLQNNERASWSFDKESISFDRPAASAEAVSYVTKNLAKPIYYHIFSSTTAPQLMLQVETTGVDGAVSSTYIYTKNFNGPQGAITEFQEGKIYRMNFQGTSGSGDGDIPINEEDIDQLGKCLDITVTVDDWNVILVTPEF